MLSISPILSHVVPFALVVCRLAGLLLFSPILANQYMPSKFRALLAVMLAAVVYPGLPSRIQTAPDVGLVMLAPLILSETLIGVAIGFIAGIPVMTLDLAGFLMGHQMGLSLARVYNPEVGGDTDVLGQILMYIGLAAFVAIGGVDVLFVTVASTFDRVPIGAFAIARVPLDTMVGVLSSGVELAVRVATPVMGIVFLLMIAMGFVMKTMPQINIMSVGFTIKIIFGIGMIAVSIGAMHHAIAAEIESALREVMNWGRTLT